MVKKGKQKIIIPWVEILSCTAAVLIGAGILGNIISFWIKSVQTPVCHWSHTGNFCPTCGEAFAQQCPECHEWCKLDITYCPECGYLLEE